MDAMTNERPTCVAKTTAAGPNVVLADLETMPAGRDMWFLLTSDVHWDNPHCDRELYRSHLEEARRRRAGIIDCGDFFCAMQGKYDKRSSKSSIRPEHMAGDYLDRLVDTAAEWLEPYADMFVVMGQGNHESSIRNRHETDLTERLTTRLSINGRKVHRGGYSGWVVLRHTDGCHASNTLKLWYIHGYGGGGPVTVDNIQAQRQLAYVDADILVSGHTHDSWTRDFMRVGLDAEWRPVQRLVQYAKIGTYKDEYGDGSHGWHVETGKPPKPKAAKWLRVWLSYTDSRRRLLWEITDAR